MVLIRRPFSPNPFLPLHNFQRRFDFLGTQMHCFTENHIRFGRSFTSQGANSLLLMDSEHRLSPARTDTPFDAPVPNGNRVEICLKLALLTKSRSAPPYQQKKTPSGVIRRVLSSVSGSMRSPTRGSGPPLPLSLVAKRALSCARASARKTSPRTRPAAVSAPPGIPGWNGVPGCAVGLPQSS